MLSPESLARSHKRHVTDVVRVALERRGILGFIETHESMTLREARQLIWENVEHAPCDFQFVLDDGVPVSARQENTQRVVQFYPCLKIRESKISVPAMHTPVVSPTQRDDEGSNSSTEKISVWTSSGDEFTVWISEDYTFQQLRRDAARYWNLPAGQVALVDRDGCLWPEQAKILSVMGVQELLDRKIVLESKAGATSAANTARPRSTAIALARTLTVIPSRRRFSTGDATPSHTMASWQDMLSHHAEVVNPVEELWRIFTFYCVNGDSLELECIRAHQFNRLLRDAQVLGPAVTPAIADIIYTSETKGKPQASGKMNFDEFLNALIKVALARHRKGSSHKLLQRTAFADTREQDELFQRLVAECILPRASRWPIHAWDLQTQQLRQAHIVGFIAKFLDPLLDLFAFYAKSHLLQTSTGVKQFHMAYADYQRFINDFALANLQISSVEAAQVFVASCASTPVHDALSGEPRDTPMSPRSPTLESQYDCDVLSCSCSSSSSSSCLAGMSVASAFHKLVQSAEGVVLFLSPAAQVGRLCMSFSAFLDTLGRLGLVAFAKTKAGKLNALQSVKAVFHHMSRGLTRSRVLDIVATHGSASIHAGRFYSGSVAFNNRFLDMWRYEGSPDYLAVGVSEGGDLTGNITTTIPLIPVAAGKKGPEAITPLSPSRRLTSSAALVDERVVMNGAGRGREALDRLVRNAFIRNAVASTTSISPTVAMKTQAAKDDSITPAIPTCEGGSPPVEDGRAQRHPPAPPTHEPLRSVEDEPAAEVAGDMRPAAPPLLTPDKPAALRPYVSGGLPLHPHDERSLFESVLLKGGVFKKYGQWGNPHRRFVWCAKEFDGVCWRPINKKHSLTKDGLAAASLVAVLPGNSQCTRYAFMKHLSDEKSLSRCFSLVAEDRRLDLEADSEATRDLWMQALQFLIRDCRSRTQVRTT